MKRVTMDFEKHPAIAGRAIKVMADARLGEGEIQVVIMMMVTYLSLRFKWNEKEVLQFMLNNIGAIAGHENPAFMQTLIQRVHKEAQPGKIITVPGVNLKKPNAQAPKTQQ